MFDIIITCLTGLIVCSLSVVVFILRRDVKVLSDIVMSNRLTEEQIKMLEEVSDIPEGKKEIPEGDDLNDWENVEILITTPERDPEGSSN